MLLAEGSPDVAADPVFMEFVSNGVILAHEHCVVARFRAQRRCLTKKRHVSK